MFCTKCGTQLPDDSEFCHKCGTKLIMDTAVQHTSVKPVSSADLYNNNEKYCVTLDNVGSRKIEVIKVVRELTGLGLAETKELVDNVPKALKAGLTRTEAETIKSMLANIGATATLAISDAEQIVYQNAKPRSAGVFQMALAPLLIASIVAGFMNEGIMGTMLIIVPIAIILIWSVIGIINSIKSKTKNSKKLLLGMAGVAVVVIAAIVFVLNLEGGGKYPNELLYEGLPVTRFLEMTRDDVIAEFGAPGQDFNGWDSYEDKGIYSLYYSEGGGEVLFIRFNAAYCSFNGTKLREKTYEQTMNLISSPERMFSGLTTITSDSIESGLYSTGRKFFRSTFRPDQGYTLDFITTLYNSKDMLIDIALYTDEWKHLENDTTAGMSDGSEAAADHDQAYNIAQAWLAAHPDMGATISGRDNDLYHADGEEYYLFYLGEMHYASLLVNSRTGALSIMINHDGENPYTEIEPLDDYYNRFWGDSQNTYPGEVLYGGSPVNWFLGDSIDDVVDGLGIPLDYNDGGGNNYCKYEEIEFAFDSEGIVFNIQLNVQANPSVFTIDGNTLDKSRETLLNILGTPTKEGWEEDYDGNNIYRMWYERLNAGENIRIEMWSPESIAYGIWVW